MYRQVFIVLLLGSLPVKRPEVYPDNQQLLSTCQIYTNISIFNI